MYYPDGSEMQFFEIHAVAIGWLEHDYPYARGPVSPEVVERLQRFEETGWTMLGMLGFHACEFCEAEGAKRPAVCNTQHYIPAGDRIYIAPQMIRHYIEAHGYAPPAEFCEALLRCPLPGDDEYNLQLVSHLPEFLKEDLAFITELHRRGLASKNAS